MVSVLTHLWFSNDRAVEAAHFYADNIPDSSIQQVLSVDVPDGPKAEFVELTVAGHPVIALNAGPEFTLTEAFSFYLRVDGQDEVDHYWDVLTAEGGEPGPCGWCRDRFGVSWQVVPREFEELCGHYETEAERRVFSAMLGMGKMDVAGLRAAHEGA